MIKAQHHGYARICIGSDEVRAVWECPYFAAGGRGFSPAPGFVLHKRAPACTGLRGVLSVDRLVAECHGELLCLAGSACPRGAVVLYLV